MADKKEVACLRSIEDMKDEKKVSDAVFEGVKAANGWKAGKQVEEKAFCRAIDGFLSSRIDGFRTEKEAKG